MTHPAWGHGGPHERGQNLLRHPHTVRRIVREVAGWPERPLVEFAAGAGALTVPLAALGRPLTAVEIDPRLAARLRRLAPAGARVVRGDMLHHGLPAGHDIVANVPFAITTPWLRRLLPAGGWDRALLLVQWEVARKRAGVGGATMLTAQWWPWFEFRLLGRVPAAAFDPPPAVDGGILGITRLRHPLVPETERTAYQALVRRVFTGRGRTVGAVITGATRRRGAAGRLRALGVRASARPRDLTAREWAIIHSWWRDA